MGTVKKNWKAEEILQLQSKLLFFYQSMQKMQKSLQFMQVRTQKKKKMVRFDVVWFSFLIKGGLIPYCKS